MIHTAICIEFYSIYSIYFVLNRDMNLKIHAIVTRMKQSSTFAIILKQKCCKY